jgi:hypothetical protein
VCHEQIGYIEKFKGISKYTKQWTYTAHKQSQGQKSHVPLSGERKGLEQNSKGLYDKSLKKLRTEHT